MLKKNLLILLMFSYILINFSCKQEEIIPTPPETGEFYFVATINEKSKHLVAGRNGYRLNSETEQVMSTTDPNLLNATFISELKQLNNNYYIKSSEAVNVKFDQNWFNVNDYNSDPSLYFNSIFDIKNHVFCNQNTDSTCVEIFWIDTYGKEWSSKNGSQNGSSFAITNITQSFASGVSQNLVKATFNCAIYNEMGNVIGVKNGQLYMVFKSA